MAQTLPTLDEVQKGIVDLYIAYFNRAPETKGLNDWTSYFYTQVAQGKDPDAVYIDMANQFFGLGFHFQALPPNLQTDNTALVKWAYQNVLGRDLDAEAAANTPPADPKFANAAEEAYQTWVPLLDNGMDKGSFFVTLIDVARNFENDPSWGWVYNYLEARNTLGLLFAKSEEGNITDPDQAIAVGKQVLTGLTPDQVKANPNVDPQALAQQVFTQWEATQIGQTFMLTTGTDTFVGTTGNDTFQGTFANISDADTLIDQTSTDNDTLNLTAVTANYAATKMANISGIENVVFNTEMVGAFTVDASKLAGVKNLTVNRGDLADGLISGKGAVTVNPVDASKVAKVTAGAQVDALTVTQATKAGIVVDAAGVTGNVTVTGAATITANDSTGTVSIAAGLGNATEDKKAVSIDAAKAATVTTAAAMTGAITINAAAATTVTVNESKGGVTIDAQAAKATITAKGVTKAGATITAGTGTGSNPITITATGTGATDDVATISAAGVVTLNATDIDTLNLSGNGAAANYALTATTLKTLTASGANAVNVATDIDNLHQATVTGVNDLKINGGADAAARDLSKVTATKIILEADAAQAVTVANAANIAVTVDQTDLELVAAAEGDSVTIAAAKFGTGAAAQIRKFGDVKLTGKFGTVNLVASEAAFDVGTNKSFDASTDTIVNITGDKAVTLNAVTAKQVAASAATGAIILTMSENSKTVATGSGNDVITVNDTTGAAVMSLNAGDGNNTINVTKLGNGSTLVAGGGDDLFNVADGSTGSFVMQGGAGNDTYNLAGAADVVIADSAGTDKIILSANAAYDFTGKANFAFSGIEELDIKATGNNVSMTGAQVTGKTFKLTGNDAADALVVSGKASVADTINLSGITVSGTATLKILGSTGADVLTGSAKSATEFVYSAANQIVAGETITGGEATDIISYTGTATTLDMTVAKISSVETFNVGNATSVTIAQGTGLVTFNEFNATNTLVIAAGGTNFGAAAASKEAVDAAGEWFITQDVDDTNNDVLTYFDVVLGATVDITLVGTLDWTGSVVAGNLVLLAGEET